MTVQIDTTAEIDAVRLKTEGSHPAAPSSGHVLLYYVTGTASPGLYTELSNGQQIGPFITGSASSGAGALVLLSQQVNATGTSVTMTSWYSATYDEYMIEILGLIPATSGVNVWLRFSTDGGSNYDSGSNYSAAAFRWSKAGSAASDAGGTKLIIDGSGNLVNTTTKGYNATIRFFYPGSTTLHKRIICTGYTDDGTGNPDVGVEVRGSYNVTTAVNAFQILMSSGNITSGIVRVYGIAKS